MNENDKCELMDGFAIVIQMTLALIAFGSLLFKRHRESPQRPLVIWAMDTSKQAFAASLVHFTNVFVSAEGTGNPCVWYFLHLLLDTTVGVYVLSVFLSILHRLVDYFQIPDMQSGVYGVPPRLSVWLKQFLLFITAWLFVKLLVVLSLAYIPLFRIIGELLLSPFKSIGDPRAQIVFVMLLFPLVMNIVQAWLIDMLIKAGQRQTPPDDDDDDASEHSNLVGDDQSVDSSGYGTSWKRLVIRIRAFLGFHSYQPFTPS